MMTGSSQVSTLVLNSDCQPVSVFPLSVYNWQTAVKAIWINSVEVVEYYDEWTVHSPRIELKIPAIVMTKKFVNYGRKMNYSPENIFLRDNYQCAYCLNHFPESQLTVDHVHPHSLGGKECFENIVAACSPCNNKRGSNIKIRPAWKPYKPTYYEMLDKVRSKPIYVPHASWVPYLGWSDLSKVIVRPSKKLVVSNFQALEDAA